MSFLLIGSLPKAMTYIAPHKHSCHEITLCVEGEGTAWIDEKEYPVRRGSVLVIPPNISHTTRAKEGFREIYIQTDHVFSSGVDPWGHDVICLEDDGGRSVKHLMEMMLHRYVQGKKNDPTLSLMLELLLRLLGEKRMAIQADPVVGEVCRLLALNYNNPQLSLSELLASTGYHKDHIRRRFIAAYGVTPCEYLTELRIENAKKLLGRRREMGLSVSEIGAMCGYYDGHYFSKVFKSLVGVTPSEFEKKDH